MPTQANALPPSLVNDLGDMQRRITALERAPAPVNKFDRYPSVEWAAQGRPAVGGNVWSSCGIANATGLVFDRVECKFITDFLTTGKREAEVRLAAFRHYGNAEREIVSASDVLNLTGDTTRYVGSVVMRWVHGIPFGWDYADDTTVYTIELQHRYKTGPEAYSPNRLQVGSLWKHEKDSDPGLVFADADGSAHWVIATKDQTPSGGWITIPDDFVSDNDRYGSYSISNMQYCVGLPQERIPEATPNGWAWIKNSNASWGRKSDITEDYFNV